jgi:hypothetical protein
MTTERPRSRSLELKPKGDGAGTCWLLGPGPAAGSRQGWCVV